MTRVREGRRAEVEDAMALIGRARIRLRTQVKLRLRQGVERGLADLLSPALDEIECIDQALAIAEAKFAAEWRSGERAGWQ